METCRKTRGNGGRRHAIPCQSLVRDYHRSMGGVDIHDQLRLQHYPLQLQTWYKKHYNATFMGLVDVAIVNAYIVFRECHKMMDLKPASHTEIMLAFHTQLLQLEKEDFLELASLHIVCRSCCMPVCEIHVVFPTRCMSPAASADEDGDAEFRAPLQKDHEPRKVGERRVTKYYCAGCRKSDKGRLYLCNKVWKHYAGNSMTCFQIWHNKWKNGSKRPHPRCGRDIQSRAAGPGCGKKRKRHENIEEKQGEDDVQEPRENQTDSCGSGDASAEDGDDKSGGVLQ
ncbi:Hypothetical protein PHPALM_6622, partial [Phytophthora palmivora]